jgi:hypothetical protein
VVALSVNPGAVRSDIWRHLPFHSALRCVDIISPLL